MLFMRRGLMALVMLVTLTATQAQAKSEPNAVLDAWYKLVIELVRHTATYSPPVASRAFAYLGVTTYEAVASGSDSLVSLEGQLNGLKDLPRRQSGQVYDEAVVLDAAMAASVNSFFSNTGPSGQRAITAMSADLAAKADEGVPQDVVARSRAYGQALAAAIDAWAATDGGAKAENMGFPREYALKEGPGHWVPTSMIRQQQVPLLPAWGKNRPFAMPDGLTCDLPPPPAYSEDKNSQFYKEAFETYQAVKTLTPEQEIIARFWSDDPMLSSTPPGHWIQIAFHLFERDSMPIEKRVDVNARLGVALADAFIGCWATKFEFDLVRPVSYIKKVIDKKWEPLLITPPFPEYPSGHSTQSGAAATVLTAALGDNFAFEDHAHVDDGFEPRSFNSFWEAANEAGISRLYGGIHFRAAIERGLDQGRCIGDYAVKLRTAR